VGEVATAASGGKREQNEAQWSNLCEVNTSKQIWEPQGA